MSYRYFFVWFVVLLVPFVSACIPEPKTEFHFHEIKDDAETHFKQGMNFASRSDYGNAVLEFKRSIDIKPSSKAYANLGVCYRKMGQVNKAVEALSRAVRINSCDGFAQYNLAGIYSVTDKTDLGLDALDRALQCGFNNYNAIRFDNDLNNLRAEPEFRRLLEKHKIFLQ